MYGICHEKLLLNDTSLRVVAPSLLSGGGCGYTQARMTQSQLRVQQYVSRASNVTNHKNQLCKTARLTRLSFQKAPLRSVSLLFESICASFFYLILYLFFILIFLQLFLCISQFGGSREPRCLFDKLRDTAPF